MKFRILHRGIQTSNRKARMKSLRLPRETHRFGASSNPPRLATFLQPSRTPAPATYFATCRNPCACHAKHTLTSTLKTPRNRQFLTILTSKSFSRAGVVQILRSWTSKRAPKPSSFNDFNFRIALARRRGANFVDIFFGSRSFATPAFRTCLSEPSKPWNYGKTQHCAQFLPAKISHVAHLCCKTSLLSNIDAARPSGNFQYSRKLELLNFLW